MIPFVDWGLVYQQMMTHFPMWLTMAQKSAEAKFFESSSPFLPKVSKVAGIIVAYSKKDYAAGLFLLEPFDGGFARKLMERVQQQTAAVKKQN